ncbi:D-ribitol-5-phosphate phosphatase [bioreactor metagenome]|uniref:D-ribitol-5-phosphate phosphatase n=1 Tax=bioreactor metagenome TaxID=1076179 RepID=A0A645FXP6_9ZZZZ
MIFDLGGVIYNIDIQKGIDNFKKIGFINADNYIGKFTHSGFFIQWEKGEITPETFRNEIKKLSNNPLTDKQIDDAWCSIMLDIPRERIDLLLALRKKYKLLLLSNTNYIHINRSLPEELAKFGLTMDELFDKCYYSYLLGAIKPHADIFEKLLQDAQVKPEECLFLDDGEKNILTAKSLGFNTYHVTPGESLDFLK